MIRFLGGQIDQNHPIMWYLINPVFWDEDIGPDCLELFYAIFPADINLSHTFLSYQIIYELNQVAEQRALGPQIEQRSLAKPLDIIRKKPAQPSTNQKAVIKKPRKADAVQWMTAFLC